MPVDKRWDQKPAVHRHLYSGSRGADVKRLQHGINLRLKARHRFWPVIGIRSYLELDGEFGPSTRKAWIEMAKALGFAHRKCTTAQQSLMRHPNRLTKEQRQKAIRWEAAARHQLAQRTRPSKGRALAIRFYKKCKVISDAGGPYLWGGGHTKPLAVYHGRQGYDCSGSISLALWRARLFPWSTALVSWGFAKWGRPGRGRFFTVWENFEHVWVQFHLGPDFAWRFDTSPHGSGGYGPRLRWGARSTASFTPRHFPGL